SVRTKAKYLDMAIFKEVMEGRGTASGGVFLDLTRVGRDTLLARAPITYETLRRAGIDLAQKQIEIGLVVQNFNGGILIDAHGFTGIEGLYAAGEVSGGVHGADRPGGNNLIDTQVFGYRAGRAAAGYAAKAEKMGFSAGIVEHLEFGTPSGKDVTVLQESANIYYSNLTIIRTRKGL